MRTRCDLPAQPQWILWNASSLALIPGTHLLTDVATKAPIRMSRPKLLGNRLRHALEVDFAQGLIQDPAHLHTFRGSLQVNRHRHLDRLL